MGAEWLPRIPVNDPGPWYCYLLWIEEKSAYYVGHTGKFAGRMKAHYDGKVLTTKGYEYKEIWRSEPLASRTASRHFERDLKVAIRMRDTVKFSALTQREFVEGAVLMRYTPRRL